MPIEVIVRLALPVFFNVTGTGLLDAPTLCGWNARLAGIGVRNPPLTPVPESGTRVGLLRVLSVIVRAPESSPVDDGVNVTEAVQEAPGSRMPPQSLVWLNGAAVTTLAMVIFTLLLFVTVRICGALVVVTPCEPKFSVEGDTALKDALSSTEIVLLFPKTLARSGTPSPFRSV